MTIEMKKDTVIISTNFRSHVVGQKRSVQAIIMVFGQFVKLLATITSFSCQPSFLPHHSYLVVKCQIVFVGQLLLGCHQRKKKKSLKKNSKFVVEMRCCWISDVLLLCELKENENWTLAIVEISKMIVKFGFKGQIELMMMLTVDTIDALSGNYFVAALVCHKVKCP